MKKILAFLLATLMILSLAACDGVGSDKTVEIGGDDVSVKETQVDVTEASAVTEPGEEYNAGDFTVYVPGGWDAVEVTATETGEVEPNIINIYKGAEYDESADSWKTFGKPHVYIFRYEGDELDLVPGEKSLWENAEDIPDVQIGNYTWRGFSYDQFGEDGVNIWTVAGDYGYRLSIAFQHETSLDDPDVQAIIGSLI